jgi:hypothetical protein
LLPVNYTFEDLSSHKKYENKKIQKCKINSCAYRFTSALTTIVLLFLVSMPLAKQVKDDALLNSSGLV